MTYTTERLSADDLLNILALSNNATAIYTTEDILIETVNDKMLEAWQKDRSVIGMRIEDALPAMKGQPFFEILKEVWHTGNTYNASNVPAYIETNGQMQRYYFDFEYRAVKKPDGSMWCILHTSRNVTDSVQKSETIRVNELELIRLNKDLSRANRDMAERNKELNQLNDNLISSQKDMSIMYARMSASEETFRTVCEQIPIALNILLTRELKTQLVNDRMLEIWGKNITPETVVGKSLLEVNPEFRGQPFMSRLDEVYTTGIAYHSTNEKATIVRNGKAETNYYSIIYHPLKEANGAVYGILQIATDTTAEVLSARQIQNLNEELAATNEEMAASNEELRALNEEMQMIQDRLSDANHKLVEYEERFRAIAGSSEIMVSVTNTEGKPVYINESMQRLTGLPLNEFVRIGYANLVHPDDKEEYKKSFDHAFIHRQEYRDEFKLRSFNGSYRTLSSYVMPMFDAAGHFIGFVRTLIDITERRENQIRLQEANEELAVGNEELRSTNEEMLLIQDHLQKANTRLTESEDRFRTMAESTNVFIGVSDEIGNAIYFNRIWSDTTGRSNENLLQFGWADLLHPDDKETALSIYKAAVDKKSPFTNEFRILTKEDKYIWLLVQGLPRMHPDGSFAGHIGSGIDITERKRDDQRKNDFIGMVSHELKTPLTSLNGYLEIVKMDAKDAGNKQSVTLLDKAGKQITKMTTIINGFLNVSRLESGKLQIEKRRFDIAKLVVESKEEITGMYNNHKLIFEPVEETFVYADWDKIGHVINNFISNAVKYSPFGSTIHIACVTINGQEQVSVRDEGLGIAPEDQERIFERYYRVENASVQSISGFGIGLYLCAEIIRRNDGRIWVESTLGKGSTFYFSLPVVD